MAYFSKHWLTTGRRTSPAIVLETCNKAIEERKTIKQEQNAFIIIISLCLKYYILSWPDFWNGNCRHFLVQRSKLSLKSHFFCPSINFFIIITFLYFSNVLFYVCTCGNKFCAFLKNKLCAILMKRFDLMSQVAY